MDNHDQFVADMGEILEEPCSDLVDALFHAMGAVDRHLLDAGVHYLGEIGYGVFSTGPDVESARWYPEANLETCRPLLVRDLGEDLVAVLLD